MFKYVQKSKPIRSFSEEDDLFTSTNNNSKTKATQNLQTTTKNYKSSAYNFQSLKTDNE